MKRFAMSNFALMMSYRNPAKEVQKIIDRLDIAPANDRHPPRSYAVRVAATQLLLKRYRSVADYIMDIHLYVADAVRQHAQLICFPAYSGLLPASYFPQHEPLLKTIAHIQGGQTTDVEDLIDYLSYFSDPIFEVYYTTMSTLAARHNMPIMAGSTFYFEKERLCHRALMFDASGSLIGLQDKIALSPIEFALGIEPADEIKVFQSSIGPVSICIREDANCFEIAHVACTLGAKILLHPTIFFEEYTPLHSVLGLNMRVQENSVWGIQSTMVGATGFGSTAHGPCAIFAPVSLTSDKNGIFASSSGAHEEEVLCEKISMHSLAHLYNPYQSDTNPVFIQRYINSLL